MIKNLIHKLASPLKKALSAKSSLKGLGKRVELTPQAHGIDHSLVDDRAVKVVQTLVEAGFEAYIVGGAVRDLLLGLRPKDFDVATNATPEEVKSLFRRAFIIGRRFRIVHVVFGRGRDHEVIEVSTFRALMDTTSATQVSGNEKTSKGELAGKTHAVDTEGRILRDNVWGPQNQDAARRDFTVNAMYYNPITQILVDYHGGVKDTQKKLLRMIGDPASRYREDPVRILRAVRFAAKLGFQIEPKTKAPIQDSLSLLENVPQSRTFDEMIKLLQTGHSLASLDALKKHGLWGQGVFPILDAVLDASAPHRRVQFIQIALADTDRRVAEGKPVAPSFMLACLLWHDVLDRWEQSQHTGELPFPALQQAVYSVFDARIGDISGRGKLGADMREIWMMQPRFERRVGSGPFTLIDHPRFRAGFDFLRLRADAKELPDELADWWEDFSLGDEEERRALIDVARDQDAVRRAASITSAKSKNKAPGVSSPDTENLSPTDPPAKKRRRRRRKPDADTGPHETSNANAAKPRD